MATKKKGLGKGLDALISPNMKAPEPEAPKAGKKTPEGKEKSAPEKKTAKTSTGISKKNSGTKPKPVVKKKSESTAKAKTTKAKASDTVESIKTEPLKETGAVLIRIEEIEPGKTQPRKDFAEEALNELADSIRQHGVLQPLIVSRENDYYKIIAGERRWRAARMAGLEEIPVMIMDVSEREAMELALIENIQREDLNPVEEAQAYQRLIDSYGLTQDEAADRVSKSRSAVTNSLRLLKLDPRVVQMIAEDMISAGHGRALLALSDQQMQYDLAMRIFDNKLSVRETERIIKNIQNPRIKKAAPDPMVMEAYHAMEDRIASSLGSRVSINPGARKKGKIEIEYYSEEDLDRIVGLLTSV